MARLNPSVLTVVLAAGLASASAASAQIALPDAVETAPLSTDAFSTGTLDRAEGALPTTLWDGSDAQTLEFLLLNMPARPSAPSLGEVMKRTLLSPGSAPAEASSSLGGKKLLALARAGFVDDARTVASLSTAGRSDPWVGQAHAVGDLLDGNIAGACQRNASLNTGRDNPFWVKLRILCYAQAGERDAADLTLGVLRDQNGLSAADEAFLTAAVTGVAPKTPPAAETALQYAIARKLDFPVMPGLLGQADGGVLMAIAKDDVQDIATRVEAAQRAVAMGVMNSAMLAGLLDRVEFDVAEIAAARETAAEKAGDPLTDALLYQSVRAMNAPEFLRDKAQRVALALSLADSFHRAYALSLLYADDIAALEGAIMSPDEAAAFSLARMAIGDSVGAGQWLAAMIGQNAGVGALPEAQALAFIERVNLLAVLDPQTAIQIAGAADVAILDSAQFRSSAALAHSDPDLTAQILDAAFDAAVDGKTGQAGLVALAASTGTEAGGDVESVVISQSLRIAGMGELQRRYVFERAWASTFTGASEPEEAAAAPVEEAAAETAEPEERGFTPRLKPRGTQ